MSRDLFGIMVMGPIELDPGSLGLAVTHFLQVRAVLAPFFSTDPTADPIDIPVTEQPVVVQALRALGLGEQFEGAGLREWLDDVSHEFMAWNSAAAAAKDFTSTMNDFWHFWRAGASDAVSRVFTLPDEKFVVVFAGDTTSGGLPDGEGYTLLTRLDRLGVLRVLGIE